MDVQLIDYEALACLGDYISEHLDNIHSNLRSIERDITAGNIYILESSAITETGVGKIDVKSRGIFSPDSSVFPKFFRVVTISSSTLTNGILYYDTVPFRNVTDNSLVRIQKDAVIYYAGGVAYCFTGEGIYSLLWDDTEKKGWVTKVKMDNESYYISYLQDSLPNVTVTAGDFTWDATERTLTATGAASTTKTATIKFNEDVSGFYFSLSNTSGTGRYGILSVKVNNEDYYIGHMQGLGTDYGQWDMNKNDVLTITYEGDLTSTADETFVFKIIHWQKAAETTSAGSYANYVNGMSQLSEQMTTARIDTDVQNLKYDLNNSMTDTGWLTASVGDATAGTVNPNYGFKGWIYARRIGKQVTLIFDNQIEPDHVTSEADRVGYLKSPFIPSRNIYLTSMIRADEDLIELDYSDKMIQLEITTDGSIYVMNASNIFASSVTGPSIPGAFEFNDTFTYFV